MIKFSILGSGSKGNSIYVDIDGFRLLVDAGFTKKETQKRLAKIGRVVDDVQSVFFSHSHKDHMSSWAVKEIGSLYSAPPRFGWMFETFRLSHDEECYGIILCDNDGNRLAVVADTGCITDEVVGKLCGCHAIIIETNYDIDMLAGNQAYPTELLERIASEKGHLRNECAADVVSAVAWPGLQYVVGWHLSGRNNHEALVMQALNDAVRDVPGCQVVISGPSEPTKLMAIL